MHRFLLLPVLVILILSSCKKEEPSNSCDRLVAFTVSLMEESENGNLITSAEIQNEVFKITYADNSIKEISKTCLNNFNEDPENWSIRIQMKDGVDLNLGYVGTFFVNAVVNPSGYAPLTASIRANKNFGKLVATVKGKNGAPDFKKEFSGLEAKIIGLYSNFRNEVLVELFSDSGVYLHEETIFLQTEDLPNGIPSISILKEQPSRMEAGFNFVSSRIVHDPNIPFMFDQEGEIRWYLNTKSSPVLSGLFYDVGMERLQNGNLYFGYYDAVYEIDWHGNILNKWDFPFRFHHNVQEKPNGNFLVTVNAFNSFHLNGVQTVEDHVIEIDRITGEIIKVWDLKNILDEQRTAWANNLQAQYIDWAHANAVIYDPRDNTIIVSCRLQGMVKVDYDDNVKWIMAPHKDWGSNRNGDNLNQFLLNAVDQNGELIRNEDVQNGIENHPDFEWNWYQHAPEILENGNLILFDNGENRNFNFNGSYSRAVEFKIDEQAKRIQQVWSYGKERNFSCFSNIVSDVDKLPQTGNILFAPGAILGDGEWKGKIVEIDPTNNEVVFEANINSGSFITFHRAERLAF